jgi:hypothetical protein
MLADDGGTTAMGLQRALDLRSSQTAWAMLHRLRSAMAPPRGDRLSGRVHVGVVPLRGARSSRRSSAVVVAVAAERRGRSTARCRLAVVGGDPEADLRRLLDASVAPGTEVVVTGPGSSPLAAASHSAEPATTPDVGHRADAVVEEVASAVSAWLLGPLHGGVAGAHLPAYLDEFSFRFDGRGAPATGVLFHRLLRQAVVTPPLDAAAMVRRPTPRRSPPEPPVDPRRRPARSGARTAERPWRSR